MGKSRQLAKRVFKIKNVIIFFIAFFLIIAFTPDTNREEMIVKYGGTPSQFIELESGKKIHYRDEGKRDLPILIFLHGNNADLHDWQNWISALSGKYRVIRYDQYGHGLTGPNVENKYEAKDFANSLDEFVKKLGIQKFTLVGHSMGGRVALEYALTHQEYLNGLVLLGPLGAPSKQKIKGNIGFKLAQTPIINNSITLFSPRLIVEKSVKQTFYVQSSITNEIIDRYWELMRYPGNRQAMVKRFSTHDQDFSQSQMARINTPTLILWGQRDNLVSQESVNWYDKFIPNSELIIYPEIGHMPMIENATQSLNDFELWLQKNV